MPKLTITDYHIAAQKEIKRRGITMDLTEKDIRILNQYQATGRTAVKAGAQMAMDLIRTT